MVFHNAELNEGKRDKMDGMEILKNCALFILCLGLFLSQFEALSKKNPEDNK